MIAYGLGEPVLGERPANPGREHRIDYQRDLMFFQQLRDQLRRFRAIKHTRLDGADLAVSDYGTELGLYDLARYGEYLRDLAGVLSSYGRDDAHSMHIQRAHGLYIGLDARSADGVGARYRQSDLHTAGYVYDVLKKCEFLFGRESKVINKPTRIRWRESLQHAFCP